MEINGKELIALAIWGCPDYCETISRLAYVVTLTVDKDAKRLIAGLHDRLLAGCTADEYSKLYSRAVDYLERERIRQLSRKNDRIKRMHRARTIAERRGWVIVNGGCTE